MVFVVAVGLLVILAGMVVCTDRIDHYWKNRKTMTTTPRTGSPPFITSLTQCVDCGIDNELLNLDRQCLHCFRLIHG